MNFTLLLLLLCLLLNNINLSTTSMWDVCLCASVNKKLENAFVMLPFRFIFLVFILCILFIQYTRDSAIVLCCAVCSPMMRVEKDFVASFHLKWWANGKEWYKVFNFFALSNHLSLSIFLFNHIGCTLSIAIMLNRFCFHSSKLFDHFLFLFSKMEKSKHN